MAAAGAAAGAAAPAAEAKTSFDVVLISFPADKKIGLRIGKQALRNGLLIRYDPAWIAFGPPLVVTEQDIDAMVAILEQSMREVLREL